MSLATITSKGQLTVPVEFRTSEHLTTGTKVEFFRLPGGGLGMIPRASSIADLFGCLPKPAHTTSDEQAQHAVASALLDDDDRIRAGR